MFSEQSEVEPVVAVTCIVMPAIDGDPNSTYAMTSARTCRVIEERETSGDVPPWPAQSAVKQLTYTGQRITVQPTGHSLAHDWQAGVPIVAVPINGRWYHASGGLFAMFGQTSSIAPGGSGNMAIDNPPPTGPSSRTVHGAGIVGTTVAGDAVAVFVPHVPGINAPGWVIAVPKEPECVVPVPEEGGTPDPPLVEAVVPETIEYPLPEVGTGTTDPEDPEVP